MTDSPAETECERPCGSIRCETYGCQEAPVSPVDSPALDLLNAGRREATEDRRIAGLMREARNRRKLERRSEVTEALVAEVAPLRAEKVRGDDATRDCIRDLRSEVERLRVERDRLAERLGQEIVVGSLNCEQSPHVVHDAHVWKGIHDGVGAGQINSYLCHGTHKVFQERDRLAAQVQAVDALFDSGVFDVREWGERGTPFSNGGDRAFRRVKAALAVPAATEETEL